MTIIFNKTGPIMRYSNGALQIEDLNPQLKTTWTLSRYEMLRLGWRCILAAASP